MEVVQRKALSLATRTGPMRVKVHVPTNVKHTLYYTEENINSMYGVTPVAVRCKFIPTHTNKFSWFYNVSWTLQIRKVIYLKTVPTISKYNYFENSYKIKLHFDMFRWRPAQQSSAKSTFTNQSTATINSLSCRAHIITLSRRLHQHRTF